MTTSELTGAIRALDTGSINWKLALYSSQKTSEGNELDWFICNMQSIPEHINQTKDFLLRKPIADKSIEPYSPFLSYKECIFVLKNSDEMVHAALFDIFSNIEAAEAHPPIDFISGRLPKPSGYAFYASDSEDRILFMNCKNPIFTGATLYIGEEDSIEENKKPAFKFTTSVDFLSINGNSYLFTPSIENTLSFNNRYIAIAASCLKILASAGIIGNLDSFEQTALKIKNAKKFMSFNENILNRITALPIIERIEYLEKYGVELDKDGRMNSYEPLQSELIIDLLCGRSCLDPLNRLSVGSIVPRE